MKTEKVTVKVEPNEISRFKVLIEFLQSTMKGLTVSNFKYGKLGGEAIISFDVDENNYEDFVHKLNINRFKILMLSKAITTDFNKISDIYYKKETWENLDKAKKNIGDKVTFALIDNLTKDGKYEELIKIIKDIRYAGDLAKYATENLNTAISNLIKKCNVNPNSHRTDVEERIKTLIKIAGDDKLRLLQKFEMMNDAGKKAIEICSTYKEIVDYLIQIANNNLIHNSLNILAVLQFATIVMSDQEKFEIEINRAVRNLNLRYLDIAFDVVQDYLSLDQKEKYATFVQFIKNKRENL
jgi:hypothetical protein